jgi:hypothetical protein
MLQRIFSVGWRLRAWGTAMLIVMGAGLVEESVAFPLLIVGLADLPS